MPPSGPEAIGRCHRVFMYLTSLCLLTVGGVTLSTTTSNSLSRGGGGGGGDDVSVLDDLVNTISNSQLTLNVEEPDGSAAAADASNTAAEADSGTVLMTAEQLAKNGNSMAARLDSIEEAIKRQLNGVQRIEAGHWDELNRTHYNIQSTRTQQENNEKSRQACLVANNEASVELNNLLRDMISGAEQVNDDVATANKVKRRMELDLSKFNDRISSLDAWLLNMDKWTKFVLDQTTTLDRAQARLLRWGDETRSTLNTHEVGVVKLGREMFNLETSILSLQETIMSAAGTVGYKPLILTIPEAGGGNDWLYTPFT
ncbi:hypothetical protein FOZ63_022290 [Perkinsus olseni]|uniref:Uncharacterized protein n=1 Tax=Perkinsus olseni TaxID=32597 RepID=A0A7J6SIN3_PEROL|nr:hypothetical protein FOZ63_022290 [Perkinsus olseni]